MNNIGFNTGAGVTGFYGVYSMSNDQFQPSTMFFYIIGIAIVSYLMGIAGEFMQERGFKWWLRMQQKFKSKKDDMGLGNRYV